MKVRVTYKSGQTQLFIVAEDMLVVDFQNLAEPLGGKIRRLEFL